ncbi:cyclin-dependent kinase-like 1 [Sparus aurata]|uniref:cyclin-dependent kinase-like 1 n=1 Tax=Sparus aurata TaxID=8175 RepID=UPI0011C168A8|nr:cyclin-dependent kinase-like 1 [Sparus aurata]
MKELREFVEKKIQEHKETLDPSSPRDYIDCFLIRMNQSCLVMDPSLRLSCEELLELPYLQEEGGANWGRDGERLGRRHDKASRRRQAGAQYLPQLPNSNISPAPDVKKQVKHKYHLPNI